MLLTNVTGVQLGFCKVGCMQCVEHGQEHHLSNRGWTLIC